MDLPNYCICIILVVHNSKQKGLHMKLNAKEFLVISGVLFRAIFSNLFIAFTASLKAFVSPGEALRISKEISESESGKTTT